MLVQWNVFLLIAGDRISPNIALLTKAIQGAPGLAFTLGLVEMQIYPLESGTDWPLIVIPDIVGRTVEKTRGVVRIIYKAEKPSVEVDHFDEGEQGPSDQNLAIESDKQDFNEEMAEILSTTDLAVAQRFLSWMKDTYAELKFWKGGKKDGASGNLLAGRNGSPFSLKRNGNVQVNFSWLKNKTNAFSSEVSRGDLMKRLNTISEVALSPDSNSLYRVIPLAALSKTESMQKLLAIADWCVKRIRSTDG